MTNETVVLVHGLWMNGMGMSILDYRIRKHGFSITHFRYNSITRTPRENAALLEKKINTINSPIIHFICHSLGGLIIRHLFFDYPIQKPGKIVTLGTPHKPSYSAYKLSRLPLGRYMLGKSTIDGLLGNVPQWSGTHDLGCIAGRLRLGLGVCISRVPVPNDGTVSVEESQTDNMKDHFIVNTSHFGLLLSPKTAQMCVEFLKSGKFSSI